MLAEMSANRTEDLRMADLAAMLGVSGSTISRALADSPLVAEPTRRRIQETARELGYMINPVARSLRSARTGVIGIVVPLVHAAAQPLDDPFFSTMIGRLAQALTARGLELLLSKVRTGGPGWVDRLVREKRADAVVVLGQSTEHAAINAAAAAGAPVVAWGARIEGQLYATVGSDNRAGGRIAAEKLLKRGCRKIAFLGDSGLPEIALRLAGVRDAHAAAGLPFRPEAVLDVGFTPGEAYEGGRALIGSIAFDGVVAGSDLIAAATVRALLEAGRRVPEDVGVVGFDDVPLAALVHPPLTTVAQDFATAADRLVDLAIRRAAGEEVQSVELPVTLIERASA